MVWKKYKSLVILQEIILTKNILVNTNNLPTIANFPCLRNILIQLFVLVSRPTALSHRLYSRSTQHSVPEGLCD